MTADILLTTGGPHVVFKEDSVSSFGKIRVTSCKAEQLLRFNEKRHKESLC